MVRSWHIRWRIVGGFCWYLQKLKLRVKMNYASTGFSLRTLWLVNLISFANSIIIIQVFQRFRTTEPLCLRRLLEKGAEWDWAKGCLSVFDALKYHLTSAPILAYPDFYRLFTVDVDDGGDGLGAVLWQREWKELWRTISRVRRSRLKKAPLQTEICLKNAGQGTFHVCTTTENNMCTVRWQDSADLKTSEAASGSQKDLMQFTLDVVEGLTKVNKAYPKKSRRCMFQTVNVQTSRRRARRPELSTAARLDQVAQWPEDIQ
ncbi:hypothetical protein T12_10308 [Trichinella patagoniensis]|uniref:Reverse transcriptase/retrotransposon-derived protein RNase H-like domain-containing protein n=1 Tax=Trichinella patagoniensis TaxID=990121 RepID=A0A0V0Z3A5_9BILA|nr:hypothetical protein T12_11009 [Trichinella patagoniensis]KRY07495.1 hypothetical protein T12_10308 [Trichinella patagoniensis]